MPWPSASEPARDTDAEASRLAERLGKMELAHAGHHREMIASKGIGQAVAVRPREAGATVLATARAAPSDLPNGAQFVAADVTTVDDIGKYSKST